MGLAGNITINLYSAAILLVLYIQARKKTDRKMLADKLFLYILYVTALLLIVDTLGRFDGRAETIYPLLNRVGNFCVFFLNPVPTALWVVYAHAQIHQDEKPDRQLLIPCAVLFVIHALLVIGTQFTGWFYTIDAQNVYHRGPLYLISPTLTFVYLLAAEIMIVRNRKRMGKSQYLSLLFFAVPPFAAMLLHVTIYGISIVLDGVVLSIFIVFVNVQNKNLITDYLTGVYNREGLDIQLKDRIRTSAYGRTFSAILLDLDHFKSINDTYGHDMGDKALQKSVELIKDCIRSTDFVARFGGDEFVVLLDTANRQELETVVQRINSAVDTFNKSGSQPFTIGFSAGYAVYDSFAQPKAEDFVKLLDQMMYQMKKGQFS
jgi:diguanylate cyclase (GGDEF)-like protein